MTSKEIVKNKIASLEDDYQHYTMVDKDKFKAHFIKIDIEEHKQILQDLDRLEELEKVQDIEISNSKFIESPNKYQTSIRMLKEAFIVLGKSDITNTCWFKYLEELEKENKMLRYIVSNGKFTKGKFKIEINSDDNYTAYTFLKELLK